MNLDKCKNLPYEACRLWQFLIQEREQPKNTRSVVWEVGWMCYSFDKIVEMFMLPLMCVVLHYHGEGIHRANIWMFSSNVVSQCLDDCFVIAYSLLMVLCWGRLFLYYILRSSKKLWARLLGSDGKFRVDKSCFRGEFYWCKIPVLKSTLYL